MPVPGEVQSPVDVPAGFNCYQPNKNMIRDLSLLVGVGAGTQEDGVILQLPW